MREGSLWRRGKSSQAGSLRSSAAISVYLDRNQPIESLCIPTLCALCYLRVSFHSLLFAGVDCWNPELVWFPQNLRTSLHLLKLADVEPHPILFIFST